MRLEYPFSDRLVAAIAAERDRHPDPRVQERMEILWLKSLGETLLVMLSLPFALVGVILWGAGAALGFLVAGYSVLALSLGGIMAGVLVALLASAAMRFDTERSDAPLAVLYLMSLAAGVLLVKEAGGYVSDYRGQNRMFERREYLAANSDLHNKLHKLLAGALR